MASSAPVTALMRRHLRPQPPPLRLKSASFTLKTHFQAQWYTLYLPTPLTYFLHLENI